MISRLHIVFTPDVEAMSVIREKTQISLGSVKDERRHFSSVAAYLKAKGVED